MDRAKSHLETQQSLTLSTIQSLKTEILTLKETVLKLEIENGQIEDLRS